MEGQHVVFYSLRRFNNMCTLDMDRFIHEIKDRPAIWDVRHTEYSNKLSKAKAWEEICDIFVAGFREMESAVKHKAASDIQRKWKSLRDSFRRELATIEKEKSGAAPETGRKEYMYFRQLSFLLPVCKVKSQENREVEDPAEGRTTDPQLLEPSTHLEKRKTSLDSSTHLEKKKTPAEPSTHQEKNDIPAEPSTRLEKRKTPVEPSTRPEKRKTPLEPSTRLEKRKTPVEPSTHLEKRTTPLEHSTHLEKRATTLEPSTHLEQRTTPLEPSNPLKKRKRPGLSDEQVLLHALAKKANTPDDPDKQFLLSLLSDLKSIPESAKLDVKIEFMNILKRYKQHSAFVNQQYFPLPHSIFPGPSSSASHPHSFAPNNRSSQSTATQSQMVPPTTPSPTTSAASQELSPWSEGSSNCDEY